MSDFCALHLADSDLLVLTGGKNVDDSVRTQFVVYNLRTRAWGVGGAMRGPRQLHGCGAVAMDDGRVVGVIAGGRTSSGASKVNFFERF